MIVKGRCRGNGSQLAAYLLNNDNQRAEFLMMGGVATNDPRRALLEMSLTSEITGRTKSGLYHMQLSPREQEAEDMTWEQKRRTVDIMAEQMGMEGHKWALFEHEKDGRTHLHLVFERYNHDTGRMWSDNKNYAKHQQAARQVEIEFGWQLTHEKKPHLDKDVKHHLTDLWYESLDHKDVGATFVKKAERAGFEVTQGIDRRPYQIVDQYGTVHDLARQLQGVRQGAVSEYLNEVRSDLRPTAEASQDRRQQYERHHPPAPEQSENLRDIADNGQDIATERDQPEPEQSDKLWEMSDSQDKAEALRSEFKQSDKSKETGKEQGSDRGKAQAPPLPQQEPAEKSPSDKSDHLSDKQKAAEAMLKAYRQRQSDKKEQERKVKEAKQQAAEQTKKQAQARSLTDEAAEMLERYRQRQQDRGRDIPREPD